MDADITFVHAHPDFGSTDDGALIHTMSPEKYAKSAAGQARALLASSEVEAEAFGVSYQSIIKTSDKPYQAILDTAEEQSCDLIFMASHGRGGIKGLLLGSQTKKVLDHATLPVLVSSVESNSTSMEMSTAIAIIKGEHRSIAAVIKGLQHAIKKSYETQKPVNSQLIRGMLLYLRKFSNELHHPKEDEYLFPLLRGKSTGMDELIDTLEAQHEEEPTLLQRIELAAEVYAASSNHDNLKSLDQAVDCLADRLWEHMSLEEKAILPQCRKFFNVSDWKEVAEAFENNGDLRFDKDHAEGFDKLYARLMNLAVNE